MTRPKRKQELVDAVRDGLLDAATRVFTRKGYAAATMKDIALEAGYTAPSLYNYFQGKEELFAALALRMTEELGACFEGPPLPGEHTLTHRVTVLTGRIFAQVDRRRETLQLLDSLQNGNELSVSIRATMAQQCGNEMTGQLGAWFQGSRDGGALEPQALQLAVAFYLAVIRALHATWQERPGSGPFVEQGELAVELFLHGFVGKRAHAG